MHEKLIFVGGFYHVGLILFHLLFWRLFRWPESLRTLNSLNRATMQVLNISITFIFVIFAYISFAHTDELLTSSLGRAMLVGIAILWLFRALQQFIFYPVAHPASAGLAIYFLAGAVLYGIPAFG